MPVNSVKSASLHWMSQDSTLLQDSLQRTALFSISLSFLVSPKPIEIWKYYKNTSRVHAELLQNLTEQMAFLHAGGMVLP